MIYIFVQIKFRSWFITWGYVRQVFRLGLPFLNIPIPEFSHVVFDDRGVLVQVANSDLWTGIVKVDKLKSAEVKP